MANKQEIINMVFWLRTACILNHLDEAATALLYLEAVYKAQDSSRTADEVVIRELRHIQNTLSDDGIDWEKLVENAMGKNYYRNYKQMLPDFGF